MYRSYLTCKYLVPTSKSILHTPFFLRKKKQLSLIQLFSTDVPPPKIDGSKGNEQQRRSTSSPGTAAGQSVCVI